MKKNYETWRQAKNKIYNGKLAFRSDSPVVNFNACRQVSNFSNIRSKVSETPGPLFLKGSSSRL